MTLQLRPLRLGKIVPAFDLLLTRMQHLFSVLSGQTIIFFMAIYIFVMLGCKQFGHDYGKQLCIFKLITMIIYLIYWMIIYIRNSEIRTSIIELCKVHQIKCLYLLNLNLKVKNTGTKQHGYSIIVLHYLSGPSTIRLILLYTRIPGEEKKQYITIQ